MKTDLLRAFIEEMNEETRLKFEALGEAGRNYTRRQKEFAFLLLDEHGVRATSRILQLPRRTLQRWCRRYRKQVKRCPSWVYEWAARRRKRREFWERRGYC